MNAKKSILAAVMGVLFGAGGVHTASAQDGEEKDIAQSSRVLDEIIVTAEKRGESLQSIPIAITAVTGDTLDRGGVTGINDLKQMVPSLQAGERAQPNLAMRGVGQQVRNVGAEAGVQVSENGVPWAVTTFFDLDFLDMERVEVLRGPQGTISGRNATGGAINVYAARPTEEFEGNAKLTAGNYSRFGAEGVLSGPISDTGILGRIAFRSEQSDGWLQDTLQNEDVGGRDDQQLRVSFLAPLGDTVEAHLILEAKNDRGVAGQFLSARRRLPGAPTLPELFGVGSGDPENLKIELNHSPRVDTNFRKATLNLAWDISPDVRLTSISAYGSLDLEGDTDFDGTAADLVYFPFVDFHLKHLSQELTLTADLSDRLDVIVGGMYIHAESEEPIDIALPDLGIPPGSIVYFPEIETNSYAIYTQWRYRLTDDFRITLGGRYTHDEKSIAGDRIFFGGTTQTVGDDSWGAFTPRVALDYMPSDDLTLYASASRGYKSGGFNIFTPRVDDHTFDPEYVWSYEAGAKWRRDGLRVAVSAFYMDYTGYQATIDRAGPPPTFQPSQSATENAAGATIKGVELELEVQVTDEFRLTAAGTWLDATFDEFFSVDPVDPSLNDPVTGERNLSGNRLPKAPEWQFVVGAEYSAPLDDNLQGTLRADYQWQDEQFFDFFNTGGGVQHAGFTALNNPGALQESYGLLNLRASIETQDGGWELAAFVNNVFDKRYFVDMRDDTTLATFLGSVGTPRMYGVSLSHNF